MGVGVGFVDAPEVNGRFQEFDFDIPFYIWRSPGVGYTADNITSLRVREDDGLPGREIIREAENSSIIENDDGSGFLPCGVSGTRRRFVFFTGQTSNRYDHFQTNRIRSRVLIGLAFRTDCARSRFSQIFQGEDSSIVSVPVSTA